MSKTFLEDAEFGLISITRSKLAHSVKLKISQTGQICISMPPSTPLFLAKSLLAQSREQLRLHMTNPINRQPALKHNDLIGKTHRLQIEEGADFSSNLTGTMLLVTLPIGCDIESVRAQQFIKESSLKALRKQAKAYLPRQLDEIANTHSFSYKSLRFSNASTRWGSCSTSGTISLNIWLMELPFTLIDYVIVHELCHTRHMNHSHDFWNAVELIMPDYKVRRLALKKRHPRT